MERTLFGVILTIAIVLTGCFLWEEAPNTVALSEIASYEVYEFNAIGLKAVAIRKDALPKPMQGTELSLTVEGIAYSLEANPLVPGILQAILLDRHSAQAIRESHIALSRGMRGLSERAGITIASVIIRKAPGENGTELYRIGTEDYISLRMANRFVFTAGGSFIAPEDVVSSEGKVYPTEIFLQARMATGSIDGAFAWLKGHPELEATGLVYNRVRLVQGQIVIDPPEGEPALEITQHPQSQTKNTGESVTFTVTATGGTPPYTYQWRKNGTNISGATASSYTKANLTEADAGAYTVVVRDSSTPQQTATSNTANLTVTGTLQITQHPQSQTKNTGESVTFTVTATGGTPPYAYQWRKNGTNISGATASSYTKANLAEADAGAYTVVVRDGSMPQQTATSNAA